eukprot:TRINITY_DN90537_c0_g1_i1.p1 TRINITY_DN90537_c0_g1~~TRINITY_DN90537_c0_g1_i1.p1  ORF type:complete len:658 (+),score=108.43 TRINITY_DN90537_c0_g1_i1:153-2126(+)
MLLRSCDRLADAVSSCWDAAVPRRREKMVGQPFNLRPGYHIACGAGWPDNGASQTFVLKHADFDTALAAAMDHIAQNPQGTVAELTYFFARGWKVKIWTFLKDQKVTYRKSHGLRRMVWHESCSHCPTASSSPRSSEDLEAEVDAADGSRSPSPSPPSPGGIPRDSESAASTSLCNIIPQGSEEMDADWADGVRLLAFEVFMGHMPLNCSGVFVVTCLLGPLAGEDGKEGLETLHNGLTALVSARPLLAGRIRGHQIALCNAGVPLTVIHKASPRPLSIPHDRVLSWCDVSDPNDIMKGRAAPLAIKIHVHPDGAVISVAASHSIMDGSSLFGFLNAWGQACRGEVGNLGKVGHRSCLQRKLREEETLRPRRVERLINGVHADDSGLVATALRKCDATIHQTGSSVALAFCSHLVAPMLDMGKTGQRVQLSLTNADLEAIKVAATPTGPGWVSTQEAVVAHLVLKLWKAFFSKSGGGQKARVGFLVDVRKRLDLDDNLAFGTGFQPISMLLDNMNTLGLKDCAMQVHERTLQEVEAVAKRWCLWHRAFEYRVMADEFMKDVQTAKADMSLTINNNSKRKAPDFGPCAGGVVTEFMTNMGPTLFIGTKTGMDILLEADLLSKFDSQRIEAFRASFAEAACVVDAVASPTAGAPPGGDA